ncbi:MAG: DUF4245 domain-containing protein [Actinomycetales bacterium]|nr:DUF4245 domain-containing protein [Actinomycetales bacterium]
MDADPTTDPVARAGAAAASPDEPAGVVPGDLEVPPDWSQRTDDDPAAVAAMREERASRRMRQTIRDMLISMLVVSGAVVLLVAPWDRGQPDPVRVVDPTPVVAGARATEAWPVLAPVGLPTTWRCTVARVSTAGDGQDVVHLGFLTPTTTSVGIDQSATRQLSFVRDQTLGGRPAGSAVVGGVTWQKLETPDGKRRAYVRETDGVTYVVSGGAGWNDLTTFTASLVPG